MWPAWSSGSMSLLDYDCPSANIQNSGLVPIPAFRADLPDLDLGQGVGQSLPEEGSQVVFVEALQVVQVDLDLQLATNVEDRITMLVIAKHKP